MRVDDRRVNNHIAGRLGSLQQSAPIGYYFEPRLAVSREMKSVVMHACCIMHSLLATGGFVSITA